LSIFAALRWGLRWPVLLGVAAGFTLILLLQQTPWLTTTALYAPPLVILLTLAWWFGRTLLSPHTPLISDIARRMEGELDEATLTYTRRVTAVWTMLFLLLAGNTLALSVWAEPQRWSLFANGINYLIVGAAFPIEYALRRYFLPHKPHPSFATFVMQLVQIGIRPNHAGRPHV
jgi:uncharacterized membrane protein